MKLWTSGEYILKYDPEATRQAYSQILQGGADLCQCDSCANFVRLRATVYPEQFLEFLRMLGIDPSKESEAYDCGRAKNGLHNYGGWLNFVGTVIRGDLQRDLGNFGFQLERAGPKPHPALLKSGPVAAIAFTTMLPWVIDRPEPD